MAERTPARQAADMTTLRQFTADDLFKFANVNLDHLTETYNLAFYMQYLVRWPEYFEVAQTPSGRFMGYIMGKAEGLGENWHGHVTALTVAPEFRRIGLAQHLMNELEEISEKKHDGTRDELTDACARAAPGARVDFASMPRGLCMLKIMRACAGYFVDLFVRKSNILAINMYKKFGYSIYRTVIGYYSGEEDGMSHERA